MPVSHWPKNKPQHFFVKNRKLVGVREETESRIRKEEDGTQPTPVLLRSSNIVPRLGPKTEQNESKLPQDKDHLFVDRNVKVLDGTDRRFDKGKKRGPDRGCDIICQLQCVIFNCDSFASVHTSDVQQTISHTPALPQ
ncbi:hypothetical protein E1301_Tti023619 [Triplophysa tibetana]|uniref:Uncharacterized protein n=1 Tax=Triplophysa tibetana TaxID=1572043 RepID=A0A5A9PD20_9TELE|nr:hypothetical protein E1301_Tti023619 [Triplophysa tibetana]